MTAFVRIRQQRPNRLHAALCGDIGPAAAGQLDQLLRILAQSRPRIIWIDLSDVTSFSAVGVRFLTALRVAADAGNAELLIRNAPPCVQSLSRRPAPPTRGDG